MSSRLNHALTAPRGNNFFEFNCRAFRLCPANLHNQLILDVAASDLALFGRNATLRGAKVVNLDPIYREVHINPDIAVVHCEVAVGAPEFDIPILDLPPVTANIAALGQAIPSPDNTYDIVVSFACMEYLPIEDYESTLREMLRVVKPGGTIRLAPVGEVDEIHQFGHYSYMGSFKYVTTEFEKALKNLGVEFEFHFFDFPEVGDYNQRGVIVTKPI